MFGVGLWHRSGTEESLETHDMHGDTHASSQRQHLEQALVRLLASDMFKGVDEADAEHAARCAAHLALNCAKFDTCSSDTGTLPNIRNTLIRNRRDILVRE